MPFDVSRLGHLYTSIIGFTMGLSMHNLLFEVIMYVNTSDS